MESNYQIIHTINKALKPFKDTSYQKDVLFKEFVQNNNKWTLLKYNTHQAFQCYAQDCFMFFQTFLDQKGQIYQKSRLFRLLPTLIFFPKVRAYRIDFDETGCMCFMIKEEKVLDKYIWQFGKKLTI